jgi:hypothetical protein
MGNSHKNLLLTHGSSQQSLVEIGSVVSEEIFFFNFIPLFFLFLAWWLSWLKIKKKNLL